MDGHQLQNLRTHNRHEVDLEVCYVRDGEVRRCFTKDISAGGLRVKVDEAFEPGEILPISMDLPTTEAESQIVAQMEVKHVSPVEGSWKRIVGAAFHQINEGDKERIHHFIARRRKLIIDNELIALTRELSAKKEIGPKVIDFPIKAVASK